MSSILVINAAGRETRVALVENGHIAEFYLERKKDKGIVGNIYKGRVVRVLPGMQAAFVDIGLEKAAFLYVSDVVYDPDFARAQFDLTEGEHDDAPEVPEATRRRQSTTTRRRRRPRARRTRTCTPTSTTRSSSRSTSSPRESSRRRPRACPLRPRPPSSRRSPCPPSRHRRRPRRRSRSPR